MNETDRLLSELLLYVRMTAAASTKTVAQEVLHSYEKASVCSKLDGKTSQQKIESITEVKQRTISDWINLFLSKGLISAPNSYFPNYNALFSLDELGINLDSLKEKKSATRTEGNKPDNGAS